MSVLKVGDMVWFRRDFGVSSEKVMVVGIERCQYPGGKYGDDVSEIDWSDIECCVVDLADGRWAHGRQLSPVE